MGRRISPYASALVGALAVCAVAACGLGSKGVKAASPAAVQRDSLNAIFADHARAGRLEAAVVVGTTLAVLYPGSADAAAAEMRIAELQDQLARQHAETATRLQSQAAISTI